MVYPQVTSNADEWMNTTVASLEAIPGIVEDEILDVAVDIVEPRLEDIAETAPPRGDNKFIWSTNPVKQRNAQKRWFWMLSQGLVPTDGRHYRRQGKPPYGLTVDVTVDGTTFSIDLYSTWDKFNLVFGNPLTGRGQLPGHNTTGWNLVKQSIDELFFDVNVALIDRLNERIETSFKSGSRRR